MRAQRGQDHVLLPPTQASGYIETPQTQIDQIQDSLQSDASMNILVEHK